jgi:hypothetical protein
MVVAASEQEARAMLETKVIRAFGLMASAELWRQSGAVHPFGEHFNALVDFVPDHYDRQRMDEAIAAVPAALMAEGPCCGVLPNKSWPSCGPSATRDCATWSSHPSQVWFPNTQPSMDFGPPGGSPSHFARLFRARQANHRRGPTLARRSKACIAAFDTREEKLGPAAGRDRPCTDLPQAVVSSGPNSRMIGPM